MESNHYLLLEMEIEENFKNFKEVLESSELICNKSGDYWTLHCGSLRVNFIQYLFSTHIIIVDCYGEVDVTIPKKEKKEIIDIFERKIKSFKKEIKKQDKKKDFYDLCKRIKQGDYNE